MQLESGLVNSIITRKTNKKSYIRLCVYVFYDVSSECRCVEIERIKIKDRGTLVDGGLYF